MNAAPVPQPDSDAPPLAPASNPDAANGVCCPHAYRGERGSAPAIPLSLAHRPVLAGLVVPYITARRPSDGAWRFGAIDSDRQHECLHHRLCQVCGHPMREVMVFLVRFGVDGIILPDWVAAEVAEPALHPHCLAYTVAACPMLGGSMTHYRSTPVQMGEGVLHAPDSGARLGAPAEHWFEVWVDSYKVAVRTSGQQTTVRARLNQRPLRIRALEAHPAHPNRQNGAN